MRQRLAIAVTLITNPEFLILDEPTNAPDPAGIVEMREIIQRLVSERGITVMLSSHLLDELSQVATHYGILHNGKLIQEFSREELENKTRRYIDLAVDQPEKAIVVFEKIGIKDYEVTANSHIRIYQALERAAEINRALILDNVSVSHLAIANQKLKIISCSLLEEHNMFNLLTAEKIKLQHSWKLWVSSWYFYFFLIRYCNLSVLSVKRIMAKNCCSQSKQSSMARLAS